MEELIKNYIQPPPAPCKDKASSDDSNQVQFSQVGGSPGALVQSALLIEASD